MMNVKNLIRSLVLTTVGFAVSANGVLADTTCSPDITVTYDGGHGTSIKVVAFEYTLDGTSKTHREDVKNVVLTKGKSKTFKSQRLGSAVKGSKLDLRAIFRPDTGKGFGDEEKGDVRNSGKECENNVTYSLKVFAVSPIHAQGAPAPTEGTPAPAPADPPSTPEPTNPPPADGKKHPRLKEKLKEKHEERRERRKARREERKPAGDGSGSEPAPAPEPPSE